jgi:hypothetical protein
MTLVVPVGHASVVQSLSLAGDSEPMALTYGVKIDALSAIDPNSMASNLRSAFVSSMSPFFNPLFTIGQCQIYWQFSAPPTPPLVGTGSGATAGTGTAGTLIPQNTAFLAHKRTAYAGRSGQGRFYLPGVYESQVNNIGQVDSGVITALNTSLAAFRNAVRAAADVEEMVLFHDSAGAAAGELPYFITSLDTDPVVATQRRRLRK